MIVKAVKQRPNDGYIIDSLGWAYYQIGKYEEAVEQLEKASQLLSDVIIIDHLGDALFYTDRKIEALFQWERALKFNPSQELKVIIEKKGNKYYWASRGNVELFPIPSGYVITFVAIGGEGYIRIENPELTKTLYFTPNQLDHSSSKAWTWDDCVSLG